MSMSQTRTALLLNERILEDTFSITRSTELTAPEKERCFALIVMRNNLNIKELVSEIIGRDKTGWKEVVGSISKITGIGLEKLCEKTKVSQLESFGKKDSCAQSEIRWKKLCAKIKTEIAGSKEQSARLNFSKELNTGPATVRG
jgi:hypothetical protein